MCTSIKSILCYSYEPLIITNNFNFNLDIANTTNKDKVKVLNHANKSEGEEATPKSQQTLYACYHWKYVPGALITDRLMSPSQFSTYCKAYIRTQAASLFHQRM